MDTGYHHLDTNELLADTTDVTQILTEEQATDVNQNGNGSVAVPVQVATDAGPEDGSKISNGNGNDPKVVNVNVNGQDKAAQEQGLPLLQNKTNGTQAQAQEVQQNQEQLVQQNQEQLVPQQQQEQQQGPHFDMANVEQSNIDPSSILTSNISAEVVSAAAAAAAAYGGLLPDAEDIVQSQEIVQLAQSTMVHGEPGSASANGGSIDAPPAGEHINVPQIENAASPAPSSELQITHEEHLATRRQKDRERYASMSNEQREIYNSKRREQYHRQSDGSRKKRRERERIRYHSLTKEKAKERNIRRATLERDRYKRLSPEELAARNAKRRARAAALRAQKKNLPPPPPPQMTVDVDVNQLVMEARQQVAGIDAPAGAPPLGTHLHHLDPHNPQMHGHGVVHPSMPPVLGGVGVGVPGMPPVLGATGVGVPDVNGMDLSALPTVVHEDGKEEIDNSISETVDV
jgi:hypothetical protein